MIKVPIKKIRPEAVIPARGSAGSAGYDLCACTGRGSVIIPPNGTEMIGTGLSIAVPEGYFGAVFARSGLSVREGLRPANCVGVCDSDYRGEYIVPLHNDSDTPKTVRDGDRIAQLVIVPFLTVDVDESQSPDETGRGAGGFGSTGR